MNCVEHARRSDIPECFHILCFLTGKAFAPEFYYDTYGALWQNKPRVYGFKLQWTQQNPEAVDRIMAYRLGIRQVREEDDDDAL